MEEVSFPEIQLNFCHNQGDVAEDENFLVALCFVQHLILSRFYREIYLTVLFSFMPTIQCNL